ncbi:MAG TPA: hypothetical protein VFG15_03370 [Amycolatopsis sp.]|nr:hypothetical protein [Amycolatopsis sp.]
MAELAAQMADYMRAGNKDAAKAVGKLLLDVADPHELALVQRIATLLADRPRTAVAYLRRWWSYASERGMYAEAAIIAACAPKKDENRKFPQANDDHAPRAYQAPSAVRTRRQDAADLRTRRKARQDAADLAALDKYRGERGGVAEGTQLATREDREEQAKPYASGFDYDNAALYGTTVPLRCISCTISRERYDLHHDRIKAGHGDDGLCGECRERNRPGIPELTEGHSLEEAIAARYTVALHGLDYAAARVFLLTEWRQTAGTPAVRLAIADYGREHYPSRPADKAPAELAPCTGCPDKRTSRDLRGVTKDDGLCAGCRAADAENAAANAVADEVAAHRAAARAAVARTEAEAAAAKFAVAKAAEAEAIEAAELIATECGDDEADTLAEVAKIATAEAAKAETEATQTAETAEATAAEAEAAFAKVVQAALDAEAAAMLAEMDAADAAQVADATADNEAVSVA